MVNLSGNLVAASGYTNRNIGPGDTTGTTWKKGNATEALLEFYPLMTAPKTGFYLINIALGITGLGGSMLTTRLVTTIATGSRVVYQQPIWTLPPSASSTVSSLTSSTRSVVYESAIVHLKKGDALNIEVKNPLISNVVICQFLSDSPIGTWQAIIVADD